MLRLLAALVLALPACLAGIAQAPPAPSGTAEAPRADAPPAAEAPVLAELFTSEGCSSCPPADALLADLADEPGVVALSYHVDYWDRLGWRDPYSAAYFSGRQRAYAQRLDGRVYTPQMVVGGTTGLVGSRRGDVRARIADARARSTATRLTVEAQAVGQAVEVRYAASGAPSDAVVHLLLVQREATSRPRRGENRGRTLHHRNVVRVFETRVEPSGRASLRLPPGLGAESVMAVAIVQRDTVGPVEAVASAPVR